jgi:hypothetical protein
MSRNHTCSRGWVVAIGFLCAAFLAPEQSAACSCVCDFPTWGFVSGGGLIPSNSPGLLWWGEFRGSNGTDQDLPVQIASASGEPLPVEYELVSKGQPQGLWLFRPRNGFKIGKSYVFTTRQICSNLLRLIPRPKSSSGQPSSEQPDDDLGSEQRINVTVSDQAAVSPGFPLALKIGEPITDALGIAAGVSCGVSVNAAQLSIEMVLPEAMRAFIDQLYFETIIDGTDRWSPSASICSLVLPGASWRGRGVDLLFSVCGETPALATEGLASGRHTVEMRASLPGTNVLAATSKVEIELRCPKEDIGPKPK